MKYQDPKFSSRPATDAYREGWELAFGKRRTLSSMTEDEIVRRVVASLSGKPKKPRGTR